MVPAHKGAGGRDERLRQMCTSFADLPVDVLAVIGAHLGLKGTWRSVDEVVRDQAALAMASRCTERLSELMAAELVSEAHGLTGCVRRVPIVEPKVPPLLDRILETVDERSTMANLRDAASECGVPSARSKCETWRRIVDEVAKRSELVKERERRLHAFRSHAPHSPVLENPVPHGYRERALEPQRLTATGARDRFVLTDKDLRGLPCQLLQNPYRRSAAPMRMYKVSDLRSIATAKYGGIEFVGTKREERQRRSGAMIEARRGIEDRRRAKLVDALRERGCELRSDSRLCAQYINTGHGDVARIADTMAEMKFCFEHTRYAEILDENILNMRDAGERFDIREESHFARSQAIMEFKLAGQNLHLMPAHLANV